MPLGDYTFLVSLGQTCATSFQLCRAAGAAKIPPHRCSGPFDWLSFEVPQATEVIAKDFAGFFDYDSTKVAAPRPADDCWALVEQHGVMSWHQMRRLRHEAEPSSKSWYEFGRWVGGRLQLWLAHLHEPGGNLLFVRCESGSSLDREEDLLALFDVLTAKAAGNVTLAWVRYREPPAAPLRDGIKVFQIRPTWPLDLPESEIDWGKDYGNGVAWRGRDSDWDDVWAQL